jgi:anti-anti-sigma factor
LADISRHDADGGFDVETVHCDATRVGIRLRGRLDADSALVLAEVIEGHLRAGRRYFRLHVTGVTIADMAGIEAIGRAHRQLLKARGTLIVSGVTAALTRAFAAAGLDAELFVLPPTADELHGHN